jgi:tRNA (guanine-N7-)-methyltransferase
MARRALRKTRTSLDLSRNLRRLEELPRPWDAAVLFGRQAPLELEVGSGKGLFLRTAAAARPEVDFLGVEIAPRYAEFAAAGLARRGLANAVVVVGDALRVLDEFLPDACLAAVHLYFPDPWWKRRHKKRRLLRESLVRHVERTLQPGGRLHFWTDVEEYYQTGLTLLAAETGLLGPFDVPEAGPQHDMDYRTHFERRTRQSGHRVFRAEFRKRGEIT